METTYFRIYKDKNGEIDFGVGGVQDFSLEDMTNFRSMLVTAIYVIEDMWRRAQQNKPENQASEVNNQNI